MKNNNEKPILPTGITARMQVRVDAQDRTDFDIACTASRIRMSDAIRDFMIDVVAHGIKKNVVDGAFEPAESVFLQVKVSAALKQGFEEAIRAQGRTPSAAVRTFMRQYVAAFKRKHGMK